MEALGNLVTRVPLAPVKREKMSQTELEELVSREAFPASPGSGWIFLNRKFSKILTLNF